MLISGHFWSFRNDQIFFARLSALSCNFAPDKFMLNPRFVRSHEESPDTDHNVSQKSEENETSK